MAETRGGPGEPTDWWSASERGSSPTEYALIMGLVAMVVIGAVAALGQGVAGLFGIAVAGL